MTNEERRAAGYCATENKMIHDQRDDLGTIRSADTFEGVSIFEVVVAALLGLATAGVVVWFARNAIYTRSDVGIVEWLIVGGAAVAGFLVVTIRVADTYARIGLRSRMFRYLDSLPLDRIRIEAQSHSRDAKTTRLLAEFLAHRRRAG